MSRPRVLSGARAILNFNGQLAVFATDVSYIIETEFKPVLEIDNYLPAELAPGRIMVEIVCTSLRIPFGGPAVDLLQPTIQNAMSQPYTSIEIRDRGTDQTILYVPKAMLTRRSGRVGTRSLATETWTFSGIGYWDERAPGKPSTAT